MAFSIDLRTRVIAAVNNKMSILQAAKVFQVSERAIHNWLKLLKTTGSLAKKIDYESGPKPKITDLDALRKFVIANYQMTAKGMRVEWETLTGVTMCDTVMEKALKKIGFSIKKKRFIIQKQTPKK